MVLEYVRVPWYRVLEYTVTYTSTMVLEYHGTRVRTYLGTRVRAADIAVELEPSWNLNCGDVFYADNAH